MNVARDVGQSAALIFSARHHVDARSFGAQFLRDVVIFA